MTHWLQLAAEAIERDEPTVLVTVCGVEGSAPRDAGARMLVTATKSYGTIGGGNLEFNASAHARKMIAGPSEIEFEDLPLGPALAQCCGGRVRIGYERLRREDLDWLDPARKLIEENAPVIVERDLAPGGARRLAEAASAARAVEFLDRNGRTITSAMPPLEQCAFLRERIEDEQAPVFVFGAGHVGTAIIGILATMPASVTWIDRRAESFPQTAPANVRIWLSEAEISAVAMAPAAAYYLILTHSHDLDYRLVQAILKRGDAAYCGLIGSATKRARFERRLRRTGLGDADLSRLSCPIGANGLKAKAPASIALSTVHEIFLLHEERLRGGATWK